ncbi:MAG: hypothetical protein ABI629_16775, partial [bacterium]
RSILDDLIAAVGVPVDVVVAADRLRPSEVPVLIGSAAALHAATGWTPHIPWEQTLADLVASAREQDEREASPRSDAVR